MRLDLFSHVHPNLLYPIYPLFEVGMDAWFAL